MNYNALLSKLVCTMDGEELVYLITNMPFFQKESAKRNMPKPKRLEYGIAGIARLFHCSIPTAQRIKKSGVINDAISQSGRIIVVDADKALELARVAYQHDMLKNTIGVDFDEEEDEG